MGLIFRVGRFNRRGLFCILMCLSMFYSQAIGFAEVLNVKNEPSRIKPLAAKSLFLDVCRVGTDRLLAVGERGHIIISEDGGESWRQVVTPTQSALTAVFFINDHKGWTVGHDSVILMTEDRGETWKVQYFSPEKEQPLMDVIFRDESFGVAVGAYGIYLETQDGGKTWTDKYFESLDDPDFGLAHFNSITMSRNGDLYIAGEAGFLGLSKDWGASWTPIEKPYFGSYFTILVTDQNSIIASGLRGNIYRSEDMGATWKKVDTNAIETINSSIQLADGRIVLTGLGSTILISNDDGKSFSKVKRSDRISISSAVGLENNVLIIAGEGGVRRITCGNEN